MSLHAPINPETQAKFAAQKRKGTITSIIVALLITTLIVCILWMISLAGFFKNTEELVTYSVPSTDTEDPVKPEMTDEVLKKPSSPSSSMSKVITTNIASPTAVPVPDIVVTEPSLDFGNGNDFGDGWGNGSGNGTPGGGSGLNTPFGRTGSTGMKGSFYDLKQTADKKLNKIGKFFEEGSGSGGRIKIYKDEIKSIDRSRFSESKLSKYYKANVELVFTQMVLPESRASIAPKAFGVEKEVEASGWMIVYEGKLESTPANPIKFVGRYDDLLVVYVNNKVVFDGSWSDHTGKFDSITEDYPGKSMVKQPMRINKRYITLEGGDDIRILIGESPGGQVGGGLFVEEKGKTYKKDKSGRNILPPFSTEPLSGDDRKRLKKVKYEIELDEVPFFRMN